MIELTDNPFDLDAHCQQVSCHFDKDLFDADTAQRLQIHLPNQLSSAVPKRKAEFLAGRFCAREALNRIGERQSAVVRIGENRAPIWPRGFVGSITHSHGYASAIAADVNLIRGIGIDSEQLIAEKTANNVSQQILNDTENYEDWQSLFDSSREYLTFVFSAKESIFKCLYPLVNRFFGFHAALVTPIHNTNESTTGGFTFELLEDLNDEFCRGYQGSGSFSKTKNFVHTAVMLKTQLSA